MLVQTGDMRGYQARGDIRPKTESRIDCNARGTGRAIQRKVESGSTGDISSASDRETRPLYAPNRLSPCWLESNSRTSTPTTTSKTFLRVFIDLTSTVSGVTRQTVSNGIWFAVGDWVWTSRIAAARVRAPGRYESVVRSVAKAKDGRGMPPGDAENATWLWAGGIEVSQKLLLTPSRHSGAHTSAMSLRWPTARPLAGSDLVQGSFGDSRPIGPKVALLGEPSSKQ